MSEEYYDEERNPSFYDDPFFILPRSLPGDEKNEKQSSAKSDNGSSEP